MKYKSITRRTRAFAHMLGVRLAKPFAYCVGDGRVTQCHACVNVVFDTEQWKRCSVVEREGIAVLEDDYGDIIETVMNPRTLKRYVYRPDKGRYVRV